LEKPLGRKELGKNEQLRDYFGSSSSKTFPQIGECPKDEGLIPYPTSSKVLSQGAGRSPVYVQVSNNQIFDIVSVSDIQFRGYISLSDARNLHQIGDLFVEDHFNPNHRASEGLIDCVAELTHVSQLTAEYSMLIHRDGNFVNTCLATGKNIWRPVWKGTGKYCPLRAIRSAYNAANRGANQLFRLADVHSASKHSASHLRYYELTLPKELSLEFAREGKSGRILAWSILHEFFKIRTKRRCRPNRQLGQKARLHTWNSYNTKHPQFPSPHEPHFHFHITEPNVVLEKGENPMFHRENPWEDVRLLKEDWQKAIERKTIYRFKENQLPVCFQQIVSLADRETVIHKEKYRNRRPIEDLNNWYWHWGKNKSDYIWRESFSLELLNWKESTRNFGFMTRVEKYLPEKPPKKVCPIDGEELDHKTIFVQEQVILTGQIYDGMPVLIREPGGDRYLLYMAPDQKCALEHEDLNAIQQA